MNAPTHMAGGAAGWLGLAAVIHPAPVALLGGVIAAAVAAPECDLDNVGAWQRRKKRGIRVTGKPGHRRLRIQVIRWRSHPVRSRLSRLLGMFGQHRQGPAHSLFTPAAFAVASLAAAAVTGWWPWWIGVAVAVGLATHILLDVLTKRPVRIWWPRQGNYRLGLMKVGGTGEALVLLALVLAVAGLGWLTIRGYR